jgi:hypothetical protein
MVTERRANQCKYCDSPATGRMYVRFVTTTPAGNLFPMTGKSTVRVCDRHKQFACEQFLTDRNLDAFAGGLAREHLGVPHPENIQFEFETITHDAAPAEINSTVAKCDREACANPARWQIVLNLWMFGQSKARTKPTQALTGLCVCQRHRQESTVRNVLTQEGKSRLLSQLTARGLPMPDFRKTELAFVAIEDGERVAPLRFVREGAA